MATKATPAKPLKATPGTASTSVAVKKPSNSSIVSIKDQLAAQAAAMSGRTAPPSGSGIKLGAGKMTLPNGTVTPGPIDVVIVDFVATNNYYPGAFDRDNIVPPVCFAIGTDPKELAPSANSPEPQAKTCAECPMNQFGSKGKRKACNNERKLAVLPPDADADTPMWTLKVATMGVKSFDSHVNAVVRTFQTPPVGVITSIGLDESVDYPKLTFGNPQPNEALAEHFARQKEAQDMLATEPDVSSYVAASARPAARKAAPARPAARR